MRILLFTSTYPPVIGGVETVTRRLATKLTERGHQVVVVTNRFPRTLPRREVMDGVEVHRRLYVNVLPSPERRRAITVLKQVLALPLAAWELLGLNRFMARFRPDVVNVHYFSYPSVYALLVARARRLPVTLCFHGSDVPGSPYPACYPWAARWACRLAQSVVMCSGNLRDLLIKDLRPRDRDRVTVSHYGIDADRPPAAEGGPRDDGYLFLPARLVEKKGVETAIQAMARLDSRRRLLIAGTGPLEERLRRLAQQLGIDDRVEFLGAVPHDRVLQLMAGSRLVLVPSHWEAFGMVCLEAMICGKAIVGSSNGGIAEIVIEGETGRLVPARDPLALAEALQSCLQSPKLLEAMGEAGRRRALEHFTWDQMIDRYEAAFAAARRGVS